ncbi:hypothetical protein HDV03_005013 [Kappamyces sp. JEL0829]|nr:hypothetical protein HDV03_005013 [Kappamyces sp. JEL0829]
MALRTPSLAIKEPRPPKGLRWQGIGGSAGWVIEGLVPVQQTGQAAERLPSSFRLVTKARPFLLVSASESLAEMEESLALAMEVFGTEMPRNPLKIKSRWESYRKTLPATGGPAELDDVITALDNPDLEGDTAADDNAGQEQTEPDPAPLPAFILSIINWVLTSNNAVALNIRKVLEPFLPPDHFLTLREEMAR